MVFQVNTIDSCGHTHIYDVYATDADQAKEVVDFDDEDEQIISVIPEDNAKEG